MPKIAKTVVLDHPTGRLLVDGEEFPWFVAPNVSIESTGRERVSYVRLELIAEDVHVRGYEDGDDEEVGDDEDEADDEVVAPTT